MVDVITLTCPTCGGKLEISGDIERFACLYCGKEHLVRRGEGIATLVPLLDGIQGVRVSSEKMVAELAIERLTPEVATLEKRLDASKAMLASPELAETVAEFFFRGGILAELLYMITSRDPGHLREMRGISYEQLDSMIAYFSRRAFAMQGRLYAQIRSILQSMKEDEELVRRKRSQLEKHKAIVDA